MRNYTTKIIQTITEDGRGSKTAKRKLYQGRSHMTSIMEENGEVIVDRNRIVERTREFYQQLYFSHEPQQQIGEQRKHSHSLQLHNGR